MIMIDLLRSLICEKPNCEECPKVKTLEKSVEYWKAQRELSYKSSKSKETEITELKNVIQEGNKHITELIDYNVGLIDEIAVMEERIEALKIKLGNKNLAYKQIPNFLEVNDKTNNKKYTYMETMNITLSTGVFQFRSDNNHFNFFKSMSGSGLWILKRAGLVDTLTAIPTMKTGFTANEVFDKIVIAVQNNLNYVTDLNMFGYADVEIGAVMTTALKRGDCESLHGVVLDAFTLYEYLTEPFEDYGVYEFYGYFKYNNQDYGHAYPVLCKLNCIDIEDFKKSCYIGEATSRVGNSRTFKEVESIGMKYECSWGVVGIPNVINPNGGYIFKNEFKYYED